MSLFPCNECAKAIIQSGIKEVIYDSNKYEDSTAVKASMRMFDAAGVRLSSVSPDRSGRLRYAYRKRHCGTDEKDSSTKEVTGAAVF